MRFKHVFYLVNLFLTQHFILVQQVQDGRNLCERQIGDAPAIELVVDLEDPALDLSVVGDEHRQSVNELRFVVDLQCPDRRGYPQILEKSF